MKIISFTMVGNEQEIIESFIRYNIHFVDKMIFVSSCCVDNTLTIIRKMIGEGLNISLYVEKDISFDQRYLDNKYLKKIAKEETADLIIPLDCDEFISGRSNPRHIFENLSLDKIYIIKWKNYAMLKEDNFDEPFIPRRCCTSKRDFKGNREGKVVIPAKMVFEKQVSLQTGHHSVICEGMKTMVLDELWLAHYPAVSKEQYLLRIYESSIKYITWRKRAFEDGFHIYKQISEIENGRDAYDIANMYGYDSEDLVFETDPLDLSYLEEDQLTMKYSELSHIDVFKGVQKIGQLMAIKAYNLEIDREIDPNKKTILIFGTGVQAKKLLNGLPDGLVNIRAYIDSDPIKKYRMFNKRLIIPVSDTIFFSYDKIIISSGQYYDEMRDLLLENGIDDELICSPAYLFDLM